ncbi:unnamed protein product [Pelagomonas calceolata]|uniref:Sulfotransferase domain-containing protein n=1 Tax=Pelagomonas calceolata TaxID=35677 RepID=A0A8J2WR97_9STRA|nr:unnamed protein product [Pelagomonas calceolata]|mmetsp:Transcript_22498/g.67327  ORF Transcript_22498/g.67327 Transcript_22498/m.67327 type:complete len:377 (-) Transcript_22498:88-1218(-)
MRRWPWAAAVTILAVGVAQLRTKRPLPYAGKPCTASGCRPSFLIIGIGKCGTSSLYYYLAAHPSVIQARRKQIQFFDHAYDASRMERSYLSQFPASLKEGEVTGEASPGYAQYSQVPGRVARHLHGVRILVIARDPAERAHSSYHYNYVGSARVPLPFEMLVGAEIQFLEAFFRDGTSRKCGDKVCRDLSNDCYGAKSAESQAGAVARRYAGEQARKRFKGEAADTAAKAARRTAVAMSLPRLNAHLWRQLVGRGLYISNLDWWYAALPEEDMLLVCSEDLNDLQKAASEMGRVASFIGLSQFDFGAAVARGKYNAGAQHRGYGAVTSWTDAASLAEKRPAISTEARQHIDNFTAPFNERLFSRAGHRCRWGRDRV